MESLNTAQQTLLDWIEDYIDSQHHSPSIRQMMSAMGYRSPSPIQRQLEQLREKGYIDWTNGKSRTYHILKSRRGKVPIQGVIAAHSLVETFPETEATWIDLSGLLQQPGRSNRYSRCFALRVKGDSMVDALIDDGDLVVMEPPSDPHSLKDGTIVAARVEGKTTLKHFYRKGETIILQPANHQYSPTEVNASEIEIQGVFVGLLRSLI